MVVSLTPRIAVPGAIRGRFVVTVPARWAHGCCRRCCSACCRRCWAGLRGAEPAGERFRRVRRAPVWAGDGRAGRRCARAADACGECRDVRRRHAVGALPLVGGQRRRRREALALGSRVLSAPSLRGVSPPSVRGASRRSILWRASPSVSRSSSLEVLASPPRPRCSSAAAGWPPSSGDGAQASRPARGR